MNSIDVVKRPREIMLILVLLMVFSSSCSPTQVNPSPRLMPQYTLPGGGKCVTLGSHAQLPYLNIRTTRDIYQAHSETMIVEDPNNPLHLVGGAKFFPDIAHYRFQDGYVTSLDGGCTWTDGGVLPGFSSDTSTSDPSFAFGPHHEVYAAVLNINSRQSGISVLKSTNYGKTFGLPVSVFLARPQDIFSDKPWITVDQTRGPHSGNVYQEMGPTSSNRKWSSHQMEW